MISGLTKSAFGAGLLLLLLPGCQQSSSTAATPQKPPAPTPRQIQQQQAHELAKKEAAARDTLAEIPPPSKRLYTNVRSSDGWVNPFLSVHRDSVTLRIIFPQRTSSPIDGGTMLHPVAARRQELEVRFSDLPDALAAVPDFAWPYGRVVAVEESPTAPREQRTQIRRNVETTIQVLNDLGVVVDEWTNPSSSSSLLR